MALLYALTPPAMANSASQCQSALQEAKDETTDAEIKDSPSQNGLVDELVQLLLEKSERLSSSALLHSLIQQKQIEIRHKFGDTVSQKLFPEALVRANASLNKNYSVLSVNAKTPQSLLPTKVRWSNPQPRVQLHLDGVIIGVEFSPNGKELIVLSNTGRAKIWNISDLSNPKEIPLVLDNVRRLNWLPSGDKVLGLVGPNEIKLWSLQSQSVLAEFKLPLGSNSTDTVVDLAVHPDGNRFAIGRTFGTIQIWDLNMGQQIQTIDPALSHKIHLSDLSFSADGSLLFSSGFDGRAKVWNPNTGHLVRNLSRYGESHAHELPLTSIRPSPDQKFIATAGRDNLGKVWEAQTGSWLFDLDADIGTSFWINDLDWSNDGHWLASAHSDSVVRIWNASTGEKTIDILRPPWNFAGSFRLQFSPDDERLAVGYGGGLVVIFDLVDHTSLLLSE